LLGNEEERKKSLQALKDAVGSKAEKYLYDNAVDTTDKDGNKTTQHYVGILSGGPSGKGPDFASVNKVAGRLAGVIADPQVVGLHTVSRDASIPGLPGGSLRAYGNSMGVTFGTNVFQPITVYVQDPTDLFFGYTRVRNEQWAGGVN